MAKQVDGVFTKWNRADSPGCARSPGLKFSSFCRVITDITSGNQVF
jgi:hypothetical protein